jgi:SAM-dependent methyltransferase
MNNNIIEYWDNNHNEQDKILLAGSSLYDVDVVLKITPILNSYKCKKILEVGTGFGGTIKEINTKYPDIEINGMDISQIAFNNIKGYVKNFWVLEDINLIPKNYFDLIYSFLVFQHNNDDVVGFMIKNLLKSLNNTGIFAFQYLLKIDGINNPSDINHIKWGSVTRNEDVMEELVIQNGGKIIESYFSFEFPEHNQKWGVMKIKRNSNV